MNGRAIDRTCDALRDELNERFLDEGRSQFSRKNLIDLLTILERHIGSYIDTPLGVLDCGTPYVEAHNATTLIGKFILALEDLDIGKTDPVFVASSSGKNATRSWRDHEEDNLYRIALKAMIDLGAYRNQKDAARTLYKHLNAIGYRIRGRRIDRIRLINLLYR